MAVYISTDPNAGNDGSMHNQVISHNPGDPPGSYRPYPGGPLVTAEQIAASQGSTSTGTGNLVRAPGAQQRDAPVTSGTNPVVGGPVTGATPTGPGATATAPVAQLGPNATPQQILAFINQYAQAHGIQPGQSPAVTRQIVDALKAAGVNVDYETPDEYGRSAGLLFNGQPYKIVNGSDQWMFDSYLNAEGANPGTRPAGWNGGNGYGNMFGNSGAGGPFNPPSWDSLKDYPGYQFAFNEGLRGIENSAASKGTLLTGGTMKEIGNYLGGSLAGSAYDKYFSQSLQTHNTNFGDLLNLSELGKP